MHRRPSRWTFWLVAAALLAALVFVVSIAVSLRTAPDEECDFCNTLMVQFDAYETASHDLTYYECPHCRQRGERSISKATGLATWQEW